MEKFDSMWDSVIKMLGLMGLKLEVDPHSYPGDVLLIPRYPDGRRHTSIAVRSTSFSDALSRMHGVLPLLIRQEAHGAAQRERELLDGLAKIVVGPVIDS